MRRSLLSPMPSERLIISKTFYIRCLLRCVMWVRWTVLLCPKFEQGNTLCVACWFWHKDHASESEHGLINMPSYFPSPLITNYKLECPYFMCFDSELWKCWIRI
jgi:hypothetical protein